MGEEPRGTGKNLSVEARPGDPESLSIFHRVDERKPAAEREIRGGPRTLELCCQDGPRFFRGPAGPGGLALVPDPELVGERDSGGFGLGGRGVALVREPGRGPSAARRPHSLDRYELSPRLRSVRLLSISELQLVFRPPPETPGPHPGEPRAGEDPQHPSPFLPSRPRPRLDVDTGSVAPGILGIRQEGRTQGCRCSPHPSALFCPAAFGSIPPCSSPGPRTEFRKCCARGPGFGTRIFTAGSWT